MDKTLLIAHRGYRQKFPENTMIAFCEALKLDIDGVEMDVRMTADYVPVVMHDATLDRTTDKTGKICHLTYDEVRLADAGIKFGEEFKGEKVPSLEEFLSLMSTREDVKVLLELKDYPEDYGDFAYVSCERTLALCKKYGIWGRKRLTVITFSTSLCAWIRSRHKDEDIALHGFYPKSCMKGCEKDEPYKYIDEVCIFAGGREMDGREVAVVDPVVDKQKFTDFSLMGIIPCVYFRYNTNENDYLRAFQNGAKVFTCDDAYTCGKILDKIGARKLK